MVDCWCNSLDAQREPNYIDPDGPAVIGYTRRRRNAYFPVHPREPETIQDFRKNPL